MENDADPIERRKNDEYVLPRKLKKGDNVLIFDIDKKGIILDIDETAQNALVQAGIVKMRVEFSNLRLLKEDTVKSLSANRQELLRLMSAVQPQQRLMCEVRPLWRRLCPLIMR